MLTITADTFNERLQLGDDEIILNGPPGQLRGQMLISNKNAEPLRIRSLPLLHDQRMGGVQSQAVSLNVSCRLQPGEKRVQDIWLEIDPQTPPGTYESLLNVGGTTPKLKLVVQPNIEIEIIPSHMAFQGVSAGKTHSAELTLQNMGNVPFQVPEVKHITTLDMDYLCRGLAMAVRDKGMEGFMPVMDELTKNIHRDMVGWSSIHIEESGMIVAPGKRLQLHFTLTLPEDVDPGRDYSGNIRLWDKEITYSIKSHDEASSEKKRNGK